MLFTAVAADTLPAARKKPTSIKAKNPFFIIVTSINDQLQGIIADAVNDIVTVSQDQLQPPPSSNESQTQTMLEALATVDDRVISVIALDRLANTPALADAA